MDYQKAKDTRKKSFGELIAENEGGLGSSLKSAISQKTQASVTGLKEKFDPMNIAKAIGGKTGAAIYGKVMGRSKEDLQYFTGVKSKKLKGDGSGDELDSDTVHTATEILGLI